jgi:hypothetical protein
MVEVGTTVASVVLILIIQGITLEIKPTAVLSLPEDLLWES